MPKNFRGLRKLSGASILNCRIDKTIRSHHEGTKDTKGSDIYTLKLRELRAFVVNIFFFWLNFGCGFAALGLCGEYS